MCVKTQYSADIARFSRDSVSCKTKKVTFGITYDIEDTLKTEQRLLLRMYEWCVIFSANSPYAKPSVRYFGGSLFGFQTV
jgi:hypothetical protein